MGESLSSRLRRIGLGMLLPGCLLVGCSSAPTRPVLYPNEHYQQTGNEAAQAAVASCQQQARDFGLQETTQSDVAGSAGRGAVVGGVAGAAWGLVRGDVAEIAAAGAAAGAAGSAAASSMAGRKASSTYERFVDKCLGEAGYEVIGWQ